MTAFFIYKIVGENLAPLQEFLMNENLGLSEKDWRTLCFAFYGLAHNDEKAFLKLPDQLRQSVPGRKVAMLLNSRSADKTHEIGVYLTGSEHWYTYLGRMF